MAMTDDEDMPKVWWSPCWGAVVGRAKHFEALESRRYFDELPGDAVELVPVSAEHVDARALELSYWFGRLQYANADDLPRLRGLMRDRIEELDEQGDAIAYTAVSDAPAAPVETEKVLGSCGVCEIEDRWFHISNDCPVHRDYDGAPWDD